MSRKYDCCERGSRVLRWDPVEGCCSVNWMGESVPGVEFCPYCGESTTGTEFTFIPIQNRPKTICFDVDGVLCDNSDQSVPYGQRKPYPDVASHLRLLKAAGWIIHIQTARYMRECDGDQRTAECRGLVELKAWLHKHEIPYDRVWMGKCSADIYVDDRACQVDSNAGITHWVDNLLPRVRET